MPTQYTIDVENGIVRTNFRGVVTHREVADLEAELVRDPLFRADLSELATFATDCELRLTFLDLMALSNLDPFSSTSRRALVIPSRGALYGLGRMFQTARDDNPNIRIVESSKEALAWLVDGIDPESCQ